MAADRLPTLTEQDLVARFRESRQRRWFAELYRRERRRVYAVCLRFLREPKAAEDTCHEAFTRAFEHFDDFEGDRFSAWLRRIAANLCISQLRSAGRTAVTMPAEIAAPEPSLDRHHGGRVMLAAALEVLGSLGPDQRRAFVMFHIEGLSYKEIAERTDLELQTVRSQIQNARRNFHLRWADTPYAQEGVVHE